FFDFCDKVDAGVLNKRVVESLIKAGAFDSPGQTRKGLLDIHEHHIDDVLARKRAEALGQFSLFSGLADAAEAVSQPRPTIGVEEWDKTTRLAFEKEMLGQYVSDHPLLGLERALAASRDTALSVLAERADGAMVTVAGILARLVKKFTRKSEPYVVADLARLAR